MKTLQPSDLRPFTIYLSGLDACDYFWGRHWVEVLSELYAKLDKDGVTYQTCPTGGKDTILSVDNTDLTGEDLMDSPEYQYLTSIL